MLTNHFKKNKKTIDKQKNLCYNKSIKGKGIKSMKIFRTEMMNEASYGEYMSGGYNYTVMYYDIEAETKEEAIAIAKKDNPDYHINTHAREVEKKGIYHHRKG